MRKKLLFTVLSAVLFSIPCAWAASDNAGVTEPARSIIPTQSVETEAYQLLPGRKPPGERVNDFLPTRRRIDRGINEIVYAYRGEMALGLAVSYGTLTSEDSDMMLLLDRIDLKGSVFTLNPSFGYFVKDNICVGARFGFTKMQGRLGNISLNLGAVNDISMSLSNVDFRNQTTSVGAFVRSYAGIDPKGHFGLFGELELSFKMGTSGFSYNPGGEAKGTYSNNTQVRAAFNSGVAVYIFPNVCCTLSFGLGGIEFNKIRQTDSDGNSSGSRSASKMLFRLNLADIRIGLNIHL